MAALSGRIVAFCRDSLEGRSESNSRPTRINSRGAKRELQPWERQSPDWRVSARTVSDGRWRHDIPPAILPRTSRERRSLGRSQAQKVVTFPSYGAFSQPLLEKCFNRNFARST